MFELTNFLIVASVVTVAFVSVSIADLFRGESDE